MRERDRVLVLTYNTVTGEMDCDKQLCRGTPLVEITARVRPYLTRVRVMGSVVFDALSLVDCPMLRKIYLSDCTVKNSSLLAIGTLTSVKIVDCRLDDKYILSSFIGCCAELKKLCIYNSGLEGIISPDIEQLRHLTCLNLAYNKLEGTVPFLDSLEELHLHNNRLSISREEQSDLKSKIPYTVLYHQFYYI